MKIIKIPGTKLLRQLSLRYDRDTSFCCLLIQVYTVHTFITYDMTNMISVIIVFHDIEQWGAMRYNEVQFKMNTLINIFGFVR